MSRPPLRLIPGDKDHEPAKPVRYVSVPERITLQAQRIITAGERLKRILASTYSTPAAVAEADEIIAQITARRP